ncbi:MAG: hypothetical protein WBK91_10365 [Alphaproteobacteria bacterium]
MMQKTRKIYWMLRFLSQALAVLLLIVSAAYFLARTQLCRNDLVDVTAIPASQWELRSETYGCSVLTGAMTVVAENKASHERIELVEMGTIDDVGVTVDQGSITLILPAGATFTQRAKEFDRYRIIVELGK